MMTTFTKTLKKIANADVETTTERVQYNSEDVNNEDDKDSSGKDSDEEDQESFYFLDCAACKNIFKDKTDLQKYIANCHEIQIICKPKIKI